ncbi:MAG: tetratricopeptide repeat protein [Bacteroidetes bacterium]|nr:tetratricopeptide repeat protein [Bacteroidota bacterium]
MSQRSLPKKPAVPATAETVQQLINRAFSVEVANPAAALGFAEDGLRQARACGFVDQEAIALIACAQALSRLNRPAKAIRCYDGAEALESRMADPVSRSKVLSEIARTSRLRGEYERALRCNAIALEIRERIGDPLLLASSLERIGSIRQEQSEFEQALAHHFRALELRRGAGALTEVIKSLHNIGAVYGDMGDPATALGYFQQALALSDSIDDDQGRAHALGSAAGCLTKLGKPAEALPMAKRAIAIYRRLNLPVEQVGMLHIIGEIQAEMAHPQIALRYYQQALRIARAHRNAGMIPAILQSIGMVKQAMGDVQGALSSYTAALEVAEGCGMRLDAMRVHEQLATLCETLGDYARALQHYHERMQLHDSLLGLNRIRRIATLERRKVLDDATLERNELRQRVLQAEQASDGKEQRMQAMMLNLTRRNRALETVRSAMEPIARSAKGETREIVSKILGHISSALDAHTEHRMFEEQFERTHHDLIRRLRAIAPDLTPAEIRVCVLIRCDLSTKQIAESLFASPLTIKTHRTHIRRKLGLAADANLGSHLLSI